MEIVKSDTDSKAKAKIRSLQRASDRGAILKTQREAAGLTREQLAERAGVSLKTIKNAEGGILDGLLPNELFAIGVALGASMTLPEREKAQKENKGQAT